MRVSHYREACKTSGEKERNQQKSSTSKKKRAKTAKKRYQKSDKTEKSSPNSHNKRLMTLQEQDISRRAPLHNTTAAIAAITAPASAADSTAAQ